MHTHMMQQPLLISSLLVHAEQHHGEQQVVSRCAEGGVIRLSYRQLAQRTRRLAAALEQLGVSKGERVGSLAWNSHRHMELYYAVSGSGRVLHTLNTRTHMEQLCWIANHAEDQVLFFDPDFLPVAEAIAPCLSGVKHWVLMTDRAHMPQASKLPRLLCYEDLLDAAEDGYQWPALDEGSPSSLCYTSATTGQPKGVLYSHRSTLLHAFAAALPDMFNLSASDCILPIVPMAHANAMGLPYMACMVGAKLVLPGAALDSASLYALIEQEGVTVSACMPNAMQCLVGYMDAKQLALSTMRRTLIGGSVCPPEMVERLQQHYVVDVLHGWGMTELSPLGTLSTPKPQHQSLSHADSLLLQAKQGRNPFGMDMKIVDANGQALPWDGKSQGELLVRGLWVLSRYYKSEEGDPLVYTDGKGWFPTGDIGTIDAEGYLQITDRAKDLIQSGDEWISSVTLENIALSHPAVAMAACIGVKHPVWDERPLLLVVKKPDVSLDRDQMLAFFYDKVATAWIPDDVVFVDSIAVGATGKILKQALRDAYANYPLPTLRAL